MVIITILRLSMNIFIAGLQNNNGTHTHAVWSPAEIHSYKKQQADHGFHYKFLN